MMDTRCRSCGAPMDAGAVLCIECGTHAKSGLNIKTVNNAKKAGAASTRFALVAVLGLVAAVLGGMFWGWLWMIFANCSIPTIIIGAVSVIIGGGIGLAVRIGVGYEGTLPALVGVLFTIVAVFVGNITFLHIGMAGLIEKELLDDSSELSRLALVTMPVVAGHFSEEEMDKIGAVGDDDNATPEDLVNTTKAIIDAKPKDERKKLASAVVSACIAEMSVYDKISSNFSFVDVLLLIVGCVCAWRIGTGQLLGRVGAFESSY